MLAGAILVAAILATVGNPTRADVPDDVSAAPLRRAIETDGTGWVEVLTDSTLRAHAGPDLHDVRVVTGSGRLVPHVVLRPAADDVHLTVVGEQPLRWERSSDGVVATEVDLGHERPQDLVLDVSVPRHLISSQIDVSHDARTWERRPLMRPERHLGAGPDDRLVLHVGLDARRWLRLRPRESAPPFPDGTVTLLAQARRSRPRQAVTFDVTPGGERRGVHDFDVALAGPPRALSGLTLAADPDGAHRRATVEARDDDGHWHDVVAVPATDDGHTLTWEPTLAVALRLHVRGLTDPARFAVDEVVASPAAIRFEAPDEPCWLVFGDPFVSAPTFTHDAVEVRRSRPVRAALGPVEENPLHRAPTGLDALRRRPGVLTGTMIAVLVLLALLVRRLPPPASNEPPERNRS